MLKYQHLLAFEHLCSVEWSIQNFNLEASCIYHNVSSLCCVSDSPKRMVGQKIPQAWNDEQVVVYHCFDRLFNFKYVGIIDMDEFLVPHKDRNFEDLFVC